MKILVISVHPDDETLGCGGTLLKHKSQGDEIHWVIVTTISEEIGFKKEQIINRNKIIEQVNTEYGFESFFDLGFLTTRLDTYPRILIIQKLAEVIQKMQPEILYIPFYNDVHSDHKITFKAVLSCIKSFRYPSIKKVLMMEVPSETDFAPNIQSAWFVPNVFVNITEFIEKKISILEIYKSEIKEAPFPRSKENILALALNRGCMCNCKYAEAFMLLKEIIS